MITLNKLLWSNYFSYGADNEVNLSENRITQLVGLNGHGKSSIPLILEELLYNKNSKGIKKADIVNRNIDGNKYSGTVEFQVFDDKYVLKVSRVGAAQKVKIEKNGEDISAHTATGSFKLLEEILGMDFKTFSQVVYQSSSSSLQFLTSTDSYRKAFLIDLLALEDYVSIHDKIKDSYKSVQDSLTSAKSKMQTVESWIERNKVLADKELLNSKELPEAIDSTIPSQLESLRIQLKNLEDTNRKINENNEYKKILAKLDKPEAPEDKLDTTNLTSSIAVINSAIKALRATSTKYSAHIKNYSGGKCPTCSQPVSLEDTERLLKQTESLIAEKLEELKQLETELQDNKTHNAKISKQEALIADIEKYTNLIDKTLPDLIIDKAKLISRGKELKKTLDDYNTTLEEVKTYNTNIAVQNAKITAAKEQVETLYGELAEVIETVDSSEQHLNNLEVLKKAFSTTGLLAYKIESSVKDLEALTNEYLIELSDGRFQLEYLLNKDKLNVSVIDCGNSVEITALSAGELARVTTATLLAIRKLMSTISKSKINVLFLDETIDVLDNFGRERLVELLLKEEDLNTFLISHSYTHPLIDKLNIIKEDNVSRIDNG